MHLKLLTILGVLALLGNSEEDVEANHDLDEYDGHEGHEGVEDVEDDTTYFHDPEPGHEEVANHPLTSEQISKMHGKIDANNDGKMSLAEVLEFSHKVRHQVAKNVSITHMDTNKDGKLSLEELLLNVEEEEKKRHVGPAAHEDGTVVDGAGEVNMHADSDGLDETERAAEFETRKEHEKEKFNNADSDKDGLLDEKELPHFFYPEMHEESLAQTVNNSLHEKDTDGDGQLSIEEFWQKHSSHVEDDKSEEAHPSMEVQGTQVEDNEEGGTDINAETDGADVEDADEPSHEDASHEESSSSGEANVYDEDGINYESHEDDEVVHEEDDHEPITEEEHEDFAKLDVDNSGTLSHDELKVWESGHFYDILAMKEFFKLADKDKDDHVTAEEFEEAKERLAESDAHYLLKEWSDHHEL